MNLILPILIKLPIFIKLSKMQLYIVPTIGSNVRPTAHNKIKQQINRYLTLRQKCTLNRLCRCILLYNIIRYLHKAVFRLNAKLLYLRICFPCSVKCNLPPHWQPQIKSSAHCNYVNHLKFEKAYFSRDICIYNA